MASASIIDIVADFTDNEFLQNHFWNFIFDILKHIFLVAAESEIIIVLFYISAHGTMKQRLVRSVVGVSIAGVIFDNDVLQVTAAILIFLLLRLSSSV